MVIAGCGGFLQLSPTRSCSPRRRRRRRKRRRDRSSRRRSSRRRNSLRKLLSLRRQTRTSDPASLNSRTLIWISPKGKLSSSCWTLKSSSLLCSPFSPFNLDQFKKVYSNEDTQTKAIPFFWENFDKEGWSIWHATYNYNDDLKRIFMSSNLVSGMFQRLDKLRKYAFASVLILGEDNNNTILGIWVLRGQKLAFEVRSPSLGGYSKKRGLIRGKPYHQSTTYYAIRIIV